jgi:SnoaL-like domain
MGEVLDLTYEAFRCNDANDIDGFCAMQAADCEWLTPDGPLHGREAVREYVGRFRAAFPDGRHTIDRAVETDDTVALGDVGAGRTPACSPRRRATCRRPAARCTWPFALFVHGEAAAREASRVALYMDQFAMAAQLGLLPEAQATGATA